MAIIKQAKNIHITIKKADTIITGNFTMTSKKVIIEASDDNLEFNGSKKIKVEEKKIMYFMKQTGIIVQYI
jgi:hypothetical protein